MSRSTQTNKSDRRCNVFVHLRVVHLSARPLITLIQLGSWMGCATSAHITLVIPSIRQTILQLKTQPYAAISEVRRAERKITMEINHITPKRTMHSISVQWCFENSTSNVFFLRQQQHMVTKENNDKRILCQTYPAVIITNRRRKTKTNRKLPTFTEGRYSVDGVFRNI